MRSLLPCARQLNQGLVRISSSSSSNEIFSGEKSAPYNLNINEITKYARIFSKYSCPIFSQNIAKHTSDEI